MTALEKSQDEKSLESKIKNHIGAASTIELRFQYQELDQEVKLDFFNPKFGLSHKMNEEQLLYGSFAVANKEPNRSDYIESSPNSRPLHETLYDTEIGFKYTTKDFKFNANAYIMNYDNQLIKTLSSILNLLFFFKFFIVPENDVSFFLIIILQSLLSLQVNNDTKDFVHLVLKSLLS